MKLKTLFIIIIISFFIPNLSEAQNKNLSMNGHNVKSSFNKKDYQLYISLPSNYNPSDTIHYPVLYILDATYSYPLISSLHNLLDSSQEIEKIIIVAIGDKNQSNTTWISSRMADFTSSLPTGLHTMTESTEEVQFNSALLNVLRVEVLDVNSLWHEVTPIVMSDVPGALPEYAKVDGIPTEYIKRENFIILKPAPTATYVTLTNGLKVYFQRTADLFTSGQVATGTKTPGFASPYHILLCYKAALPHCASYKKDRVPFLINEIARLEKDMLAFYSTRDRDTRHRMTSKGVNFI